MTRPFLGFSPDIFARRRKKVLDQLQGGVMILPAAETLFSSRDTEHRYRPDSELFYLTGNTDPEVVALFSDAPSAHPFTLFVARRDAKKELWSGPRLGPEEAKEMYSADRVHPMEDLHDRLPDLLKDADRIFFRLGANTPLEELVVSALKKARLRGARTGTGPRGVVDPGEILDELRLIKDSAEVERIRRATALTVSAFREALAGVRPGAGEWEVESALESAFRRGGAEGPAFPTIAGSGGNACILHYSANSHTLEKGELLLLDGGARVDLYSGDVTRTVPCGGRFSEEQRAVYEVVMGAHARALEVIRPGAPVAEVHDAAVAALTEGLVALGVLEGDVGELVAEKKYQAFFPHQTSHWLGLDVHDVGDYARDGESRPLQPGMVLTVEPGLYLPPGAPGKATPFTGIGIRLEDDILVTEDGRENLTRDLPITPDEVEALLGG